MNNDRCKAQQVPFCPGNPFINTVSIDSRRYVLKVIFMSIFVAPIRLMLLLAFLVAVYVLARIITLVDDDLSRPLTGTRLQLFHLLRQFIIVSQRVAVGFRVKVTGREAPADPRRAPILVIAPHSTFFDFLPHCVVGAPTVVGKAGLFTAPVIGPVLKLTIPIIVDRLNKEHRRQAQELIKKRASELYDPATDFGKQGHVPWPQISIFPEGTCTNGRQLISFRSGTFSPGLPVQPVCFKWTSARYPRDTVSWTWEGDCLFRLLWLTLCNWTNEVEVVYLPVYEPNEAEKADPHLFAYNVRQKMAECLGIPVGEYTLEDVPYLISSGRPKMSNFWTLCQKAGLSDLDDSVTELLDSSKIDRSVKNGKNRSNNNNHFDESDNGTNLRQVTFDQFCRLLGRPESSTLRRLFNVFNWTCSQRVDFCEYLLAKYAATASGDEQYLKTACRALISTTDGSFLSKNATVKMLRLPYEMSLDECHRFYRTLKPNAGYNQILAKLRKEGRALISQKQQLIN